MYGIFEDGIVIAKFTTPMVFRSVQVSFGGDALSLVRWSQRYAAPRWELTTGLEPLSSGANKLYVHLVTKGDSTPFTIKTPQNYGVILTRTATSEVFASGNKDSTTVALTGLNGLIPAGTMVKFNNHDKVYMTVTAINSAGNVTITPPLRKDVSATKMFYRDDVIMKVTYDIDVVAGMVYSDGILMSAGQVKMIESLERTS